MSNLLKLSIITVNYNNKEGLRRTLKSVKLQTCRDFEFIIIDGGSTDGSVELIKENEGYIDYWISEPDKGIYNAMNKGISIAQGEFCQFLNSGDWLSSNIVIESILPYLNNTTDILVGGIFVMRNKSWVNMMPPNSISLRRFLNNSLPHQASFIKTDKLKESLYNENLKVVSDWEYFTKAYINNQKIISIPFNIAFFDVPGASGDNPTHRLERDTISKELIYPALNEEIACIPPQMYELLEYTKESPRVQYLLCEIISAITWFYCLIKNKRFIRNKRYKKLSEPRLTKEQKKNFILFSEETINR